MIDLHTHSNASDGELSPAGLIQAAAEQGLTALALTDHDTINGLSSARNEAEIQGIRFISGIEIEITGKTGANAENAGEVNPAGEFHLLGLGIENPSPAFLAAVDELSRLREERNLEIIDKMRKSGIEADYGELKALSGGHSVGRPHFAAFLVARRIVKNNEQAFAKYLGRGRPFFTPKAGLEFDKAAALVRESGGIPVLAHPMSLYIAWGRLPGFIKNLKDRGLMGLEAWHPSAKARSCKRLEELAKSFGLFVTEGSDFHGSARPGRKLGYTVDGRKIEDAVLEAIPDLLK
ncbi:MAG: PHP domain-containing protein [Treponema sp.]|jgi:predicted metal-dependent phosphoesterase TrpH|nr:PHP domain-containing protein [Treponema sp.]